MNTKHRNLTLYLAVSLLVGILLFTLLKVTTLQDELAQQEQEGNRLRQELASQNDFRTIDSMIIDGDDYNGALLAYQSKFENGTNKNQQLEWRMALTEKLVRLKKNGLDAVLREEQPEEIGLENEVSQEMLQKEDSLRFALEKAKVQLARTRKQLQRKSFGEYLTFSTQKGNQLHYVGAVKHGKANGFGVAILNSGSRYKGEWQDNLRHGHGTFYWADGQYYEGAYAHDKRNGEGTYYWPNGEKYVGHWKNDERCGMGIFYDKDGNAVANGIWKADKLVEQTKKKKRETETMATASL